MRSNSCHSNKRVANRIMVVGSTFPHADERVLRMGILVLRCLLLTTMEIANSAPAIQILGYACPATLGSCG